MRDDVLRRVSRPRFLSVMVAKQKFRLRRHGIEALPAGFALRAGGRVLFYRQLALGKLGGFYDIYLRRRARHLSLGERISARTAGGFGGLFLRLDAVSSQPALQHVFLRRICRQRDSAVLVLFRLKGLPARKNRRCHRLGNFLCRARSDASAADGHRFAVSRDLRFNASQARDVFCANREAFRRCRARAGGKLVLLERDLMAKTSVYADPWLDYRFHFLLTPIQNFEGALLTRVYETSSFYYDLMFLMTVVLTIGCTIPFIIWLKGKEFKMKGVLVIFVLSVFLAIPFSRFFWDFLKPLQEVQFPWRWLAIVSIAASMLSACFVDRLFEWFKTKNRPLALIIAGCVLSFVTYSV